MKISYPLLLSAAGLTLMHGVIAADLSNDDQRFLREAGEISLLEQKASELAIEKHNHREVNRYASMILKDHGPAHKELEMLAAAKGFELPTQLDKRSQNLMEDLHQLQDAGFDRQYADQVAVDAHEKAVDLYQSTASRSSDDEVKAFAEKRLPALEQHLKEGEELKKVVDATRRNAEVAPISPRAPATN